MVMSRTPAKKAEGTMFDPIEEEVEAKAGPSNEELAQQLAELQKELEAERRRNIQPTEPVPQFQVYTADTRQLPDINLDPKGYADAVEHNTRAKMEAEDKTKQAARDRQSTVQARMDALWDDFAEQHEDKAKEKNKVSYIAGEVLARAKKRGYDPEKFMLGNPQAFIADVAKEFEKVFGKQTEEEFEPGEEEDEYIEERPAPRRKHRRTRPIEREEQEEDDSRAASIFGGNESPMSRGKRKQQDEGPSMVDDIQNMQRRMGIM